MLKIIVDGLVKIKSGINSGNWQKICDAYNSITGDNIQPPKPKDDFTLDELRSNLASVTTNNLPVVEKPKSDKGATDDDQVIENDIQITKQKGGKRFGLGEIEVIETAHDPILEEDNKKISRRPTKKIQRKNIQLDTSVE